MMHIYKIFDPRKEILKYCNTVLSIRGSFFNAVYSPYDNYPYSYFTISDGLSIPNTVTNLKLSKFLSLVKNYNKDIIISQLNRLGDVRVIDNTVYLLDGSDPKYPKRNDVGNGSLGKIDFLVNYCKFTVSEVSSYPHKEVKPIKNYRND